MRNRILATGGLLVVLLVGALEDELNTGRKLDDARHNLLQRTAIKRSLVAEFTVGRISLAEAADGFLIVDQESTQALSDLRRIFAGRSDREREARSVIAWVCCGEPLQPELTARLDTEFRSLSPTE